MSEPVTITVRGEPKPQGSKRPMLHKTTGRPILIESSGDKLAYWRRAVTEAAITAITADDIARDQRREITRSRFPLDGPVELAVLFTFKRPRSHYRTGGNAHLLRAGQPARPCGRSQGDLSHLIRAVEDSLTDAGIWDDDSQVAAYGQPNGKAWCGEHLDGLDVPGAVITIRPLTEGTTP